MVKWAYVVRGIKEWDAIDVREMELVICKTALNAVHFGDGDGGGGGGGDDAHQPPIDRFQGSRALQSYRAI